MKHFYTFLIFNVLFVSTTGGTVFETFVDFFSAPDMLIHSIAQVPIVNCYMCEACPLLGVPMLD